MAAVEAACASPPPSLPALPFPPLPSPLVPSSTRRCPQGFLAAVLAFPLGPVLIWVISTSVGASGGRHERSRSMVFWCDALSCSSVRIMCFILLSRDRKFSTLASSVWIFCLAACGRRRQKEVRAETTQRFWLDPPSRHFRIFFVPGADQCQSSLDREYNAVSW